jgi:hypothetical protein
MTFHHTFLNILKDTSSSPPNVYSDFNFNILPKNFNTIQKITPFLINKIKKEQELLDTNENYYIARDTIDNTIYICYKSLLMLDIDNPEFDLSHLPLNMSFDIYKTQNGYHVFCISQEFDYHTQEAMEFIIVAFHTLEDGV